MNEKILDVIDLFSDYYDISKREARTLLEGGGLYINNIRIAENRIIDIKKDFLFGKYCLLRKGKRDYLLVVLNDGVVDDKGVP